MSEQKKVRTTVVVPRQLPMPDYAYQKQEHGSYSVKSMKPESATTRREPEKIPGLHNLRLAR